MTRTEFLFLRRAVMGMVRSANDLYGAQPDHGGQARDD